MVIIDVQSLQIPTPAKSSGENPATRKLEGMELLFKLSYHICISPFHISYGTGGRKSLKGSCIRKVLCLILHSSVVLYQIVGAIAPIRDDLREGDPRFIFNLGFRVTSLGFTFTILYILWCRQSDLEKFINECAPQHGTIKSRRKQWWGNCMLITAIVGLLAATVVYVGFPVPTQGLEYRGNLEIVLCNGTPSSNTSTGDARYVWWDLFAETYCIWRKVAVVVYFCVHLYTFVFGGFECLMLLMISFEVHSIATDLGNSIGLETADHQYRPMQVYGKAKENISLLNAVASTPFLFNTAQLVMFASLMLPNAMQVVGQGIVNMAINFGSYLLAAEAQRRMREVKRLIISRSQLTEASNVATYLENLTGKDGLNGGNFFVVSYPFLGSMMAAIFTYVLVVQQTNLPGNQSP